MKRVALVAISVRRMAMTTAAVSSVRAVAVSTALAVQLPMMTAMIATRGLPPDLLDTLRVEAC